MDVKALIRAVDEVGRHIRGEIQLKTIEMIPTPVDVERLRESLGITQDEFAQRFGVDLNNLEKWELGTARPSWHEEMLLWYVAQDPAYIANEFREYLRTKGREHPP